MQFLMFTYSYYLFKIISGCGVLMSITLLNELLSKCFKFMFLFKVAGIIIKHVHRTVQSCHFRAFSYRMVEINVSSLRLNVAIFATRTGVLIFAGKTSSPWLEPSPWLKSSLAKASSSPGSSTWTRSICPLIGNSSFFLVFAVVE